MGLNHPSRVGMVSRLIQDKTFSGPEEWEEYYFDSGEKRLLYISKYGDKKAFNTNYGRTRKELEAIGEELFGGVEQRGNPLNLTLEECVECVFYRVLGETWNGIILREENTVKNIGSIFSRLFPGRPELDFRKTTGEEDSRYAVDYEVYTAKGSLLVGLQVKPVSYRKSSKTVMGDIHEVNLKKNEDYKQDKGANVIYVYSDIQGNLDNQMEVIKGILSAAQRNRMKVIGG